MCFGCHDLLIQMVGAKDEFPLEIRRESVQYSIQAISVKLARRVKNLSNLSSPARCATLMEFHSGGSLLSTGSAIVLTYNPRPEQKLTRHTEDTRREDQLLRPELSQNHTVSSRPSIRPSRLSTKMRKHSIAPS